MPFALNFCGSTTGKDGSSFNVFFSLDISGLALKQHTKHIASEKINQNQACSTRVRLGTQTGLESVCAGLGRFHFKSFYSLTSPLPGSIKAVELNSGWSGLMFADYMSN